MQTVRPNAEIAALIRSARKEIKDSVSTRSDDSADHDMGVYVGVHIRRGDRKAEAWPHRGQYVPITDFVTAAREAWTRLLPGSILSPSQIGPIVWVASDSPVAEEEFVEAEPGVGAALKSKVFSLASQQERQAPCTCEPARICAVRVRLVSVRGARQCDEGRPHRLRTPERRLGMGRRGTTDGVCLYNQVTSFYLIT